MFPNHESEPVTFGQKGVVPSSANAGALDWDASMVAGFLRCTVPTLWIVATYAINIAVLNHLRD
jgi:hypothetical protein